MYICLKGSLTWIKNRNKSRSKPNTETHVGGRHLQTHELVASNWLPIWLAIARMNRTLGGARRQRQSNSLTRSQINSPKHCLREFCAYEQMCTIFGNSNAHRFNQNGFGRCSPWDTLIKHRPGRAHTFVVLISLSGTHRASSLKTSSFLLLDTNQPSRRSTFLLSWCLFSLSSFFPPSRALSHSLNWLTLSHIDTKYICGNPLLELVNRLATGSYRIRRIFTLLSFIYAR